MRTTTGRCRTALLTASLGAALAQAPAAAQPAPLEYPRINGLRQAISIEGDSTKPLLLFLHGGPGRSLMPFAAAFTRYLPAAFTVVQWDQRGTGATQQKNASPVPVTTALMEQDAVAMIRYLLRRYHRRQLYLVSHSYGSVPGFGVARHHPELLKAYVAISPVVDLGQGMAMTVQLLRTWADTAHNTAAAAELTAVQVPYASEEDMFTAQKWLFAYNGVEGVDSPAFRDSYHAWLRQWFPVWKASVSSNNAFVTTPSLRCPFWLLEGRGDNQAPAALAERYFNALNAPDKHLVWFEASGHTIFNTEPLKLERVLIDSVARQ